MHPHGTPPGNQIGELVDRQIGTLAWPVDGEKPQADDFERVQMRERVGEQLPSALAGGIRGDR